MPSQSPSQSAIFLSELQVVLPLIVLPLKTSANFGSLGGYLGLYPWGPSFWLKISAFFACFPLAENLNLWPEDLGCFYRP